MTTSFLKWWLALVIQSIIVGIAVYFNSIEYLMTNDKTYLSFAIILLWFCTSISIGYTCFRKEETTDMQWFITDSCMSLGMIGTVSGFIIMLDDSLGHIDPSDIVGMKLIIGNMASGMSTALLTTLVGLIASLFLRLQLLLAEAD